MFNARISLPKVINNNALRAPKYQNQLQNSSVTLRNDILFKQQSRKIHEFNEPEEKFVKRTTVKDTVTPEAMRYTHRLLLNVGRHTKVTRGGRIFTVSVLLLIGDGAGTGGLGYGKGENFQKAMTAAFSDAQRKAFTIDKLEDRTISEPIIHKFRRSIIYAWPLPKDRGMLCNNTFRRIADAFGIKDIRIKSHGSRNPHCMYHCLLQIFRMSKSHLTRAQNLGLKYFDLTKALRVCGRDRAF